MSCISSHTQKWEGFEPNVMVLKRWSGQTNIFFYLLRNYSQNILGIELQTSILAVLVKVRIGGVYKHVVCSSSSDRFFGRKGTKLQALFPLTRLKCIFFFFLAYLHTLLWLDSFFSPHFFFFLLAAEKIVIIVIVFKTRNLVKFCHNDWGGR